MVGDMQHLSHRLVKRGLSRRAAVLVIWGMTAATGIGGIALGSLAPWQAVLVGLQTGVLLAVLAAFEFASSPERTNRLLAGESVDEPLIARGVQDGTDD